MRIPVSLAIVLACVLRAGAAAAQDQVIDRVLATVDGRIVTLSDVRAVRTLGLVEPAAGTDPDKVVLDALIERTLVLEEVDRYAPPEPDSAAVARGVAALRARRPGDFDALLAATGRDPAFVQRWVRNDLRIEGYIAKRFAGVAEPTDDDIENHRRQQPPAPGGAPPDEAAIRAAVAAERQAKLVREWIDGLRARGDVAVNPMVP